MMAARHTLLIASVVLCSCGNKTPSSTAAPAAAATEAAPQSTGTWLVHAKDAMTAPENLPQLMGSYFDTHVLVSVGTDASGSVLLLDAAEESGAPMGCGLTTAVPITVAADGSFTASHETIWLIGEGDIPFPLMGARISGTLRDDVLTLGALTGTVDSARFVGLLGSSEPDALCNMAGDNIPCGACPDGAETCWDISLTDTPAPAQAMVRRDLEAACSEPTCADRPWCQAD